MGGGIIQLVSNENSVEDLYLTGDPQITYFKVLYRRPTAFSMADTFISVPTNLNFGEEVHVPLATHADLLHVLSLVIDIPTPSIEFKDPTYATIRDLLVPCNLDNVVTQIALDNGDSITDIVTYEKLFGSDITNPDGPLAVAIDQLLESTNVKYSKRLDVLSEFDSNYEIKDNRFGGRYVAIKPEFIDYKQFEGTNVDPFGKSVKPIDPSGYIIMKANKTQDMYDQYVSFPTVPFTFNCSDFMYDPRTKNQYLNNESVYDPTLFPQAITVMRYLCRVYPRQIPNYIPIRTLADYTTYLADSLNHTIIMPISLINICRRVLLEKVRIQDRADPENLANVDLMNGTEVDECLFGSIGIEDLINSDFEFGIFSYDPNFDPSIVDVVPRTIFQTHLDTSYSRAVLDFDTRLADVIRKSKIRVPLLSLDRYVEDVVTSTLNRYSKNENAIYDKTYDLITPLRTPITTRDAVGQEYLIDTVGYWLLDVSLIDILEQANPSLLTDDTIQDVLTATPDLNNSDILINPYYLDARSDRLDYATYVIKRELSPSLYKYEEVDSGTGQILDPNNAADMANPSKTTVLLRSENILDGIDICSDMILGAYDIPQVELASDVSKMLNNDLFNLEDIHAYHAFLEAIRKDLINTEDQISDYRLNSSSGCDGSNIFSESDKAKSLENISVTPRQTLFNARDLQKIMTGKILRDIIYVDQQRYAKNFASSFNLYFLEFVLVNFVLSGSTSYIQNNFAYNFSPVPNLADRETAHRLTKFLMWAYDLEYIDVQSRTLSTIEQNPTSTEIVGSTPFDFYLSQVRYFNLFYPSNSEKRYYVWLDTNGDGVTLDPGPPALGAISVPVNISSLSDPNDTATVATLIKTAIETNINTYGQFDISIGVSGTSITIKSLASGNTSDIADNNTGYLFSTPTQGSDTDYETSFIDTNSNVVLPANYYTSTVRLFDLYYFNPKRYYVWFDTNGDGVINDPGAPAPGAISLPVNISSLTNIVCMSSEDRDRDIAIFLKDAINSNPDFTATLCGNVVTITETATGSTTNIFDYNTGFKFEVLREGSIIDAEQYTVDTTSPTSVLSTNVLDTLSKMLIEMSVDPNNNNILTYLKTMRYSSDDINEITDPYVYEDDSIIERFRTDIVVQPEKSYFDRDQILSGIRFNSDSTINDEIENLRDLVGSGIKNPVFKDGRGTAINREVEFYHVLRTIDHNSSSNISKLIDSTIYEYFLAVIKESYDNSLASPENYINTVSYAVTLKYLTEYFLDIRVFNSELSVEQITNVLLDIVQNTVLRVLNDYNEYLFYVWKNSTYVDRELNPRIYTDSVLILGPPLDIRLRNEVDFCTSSIPSYIKTCYPSRALAEPSLNPDLLKAKFWAGINQKFRPRMGYAFTYDIDLMDPTTYRVETSTILEEREFTADTAGQTTQISTPSVLGVSSFKDHYSDYIDIEVNKVKNSMQDVISYGPKNQTNLVSDGINTLRERLAYVDWFDLRNFQTYAVNKIAADHGLTCSTDLSYYDSSYIINHLPMTLCYYYGLYTQQIYSSIYPSIEANNTDLIESLTYQKIASFSANSFDNNITPITDATVVATGVTTSSVLQFMSTDIRENPECPIHSYVLTNLSDSQKSIFDDYLINNKNLAGDLLEPISSECPLCFRTYEIYKLYHEMTSTVFSSDSKVVQNTLAKTRNLENDIIDGDYIDLILRGTKDVQNRDGFYKTLFLFRPEVVYYDRVTETFYDTAIQYFLVRFATIFYRYSNMVVNAVNLSPADYTTFTNNIDPLVYPSTPAGSISIFSQLNSVTYTDYISHITALRAGSLGPNFETEIDLFAEAIMQNPSSTLINKLKNIIRVTPSTTEYIDYVKGEQTIFDFNPDLVKQNVEFNLAVSLINPSAPYDLIRYMMYRGNVSLWYDVQRNIIDYYNTYMNDLIDPRQIETTSDLFIESYNIFLNIVPVQYIIKYVSGRPVIDFYRFKQSYETGQVTTLAEPTSINDLKGVAINMIEYNRELMIYYKMLIRRYEKMLFVLQYVKLATVDDNSMYFEKSDTIVKYFLDPVKKRIEDFKKAELVLSDERDREYFYFADTSNLYYIDPTIFRTSIKNVDNPVYVDDYLNFDHLNSFQLSEVFTFNQSRNLIRMLGLADVDELNSSGAIIPGSLTVDPVFRDLNLVYTDDFIRYRTLTSADTLDNTSVYMLQNIVNSFSNYLYNLTPQVIANRGLFYDIWRSYPTVSNILYDLDFDPVTFDIPIRQTENVRYYTGIDSSSPLNILKNRLEQFDFDKDADLCGTFHTPELKKWDADFICSKTDRFDSIRRVFNVYYFLTGACDYQDIYSMITFARMELASGTKSLTYTLEQFTDITTDISQSMSRSFDITNTQIKISNQLTILLLLKNRHTPTVAKILSSHVSNFACIRTRIDLLASQFSFYTRSLTDAEITTLLDDIYDKLDFIDSVISGITIDTILAGVETGILNQTITNTTQLEALLNSNLSYLESSSISTILEVNSKLLIIQEQSCLKFTFIRKTNPKISSNSYCDIISDIRVHTPVRLFNLKELQLMNNFKYVEDVVRFLISGVVALMTPTTDKITSVYLDGVVTPAESLILNAQTAKEQANNIYKKPSIFDGAFNSILSKVIGDSNPFKAGNYYLTSLPESLGLRTILPQYPDIYSVPKTYKNMIGDTVRSIQVNLDVMSKLTVLSRYVDSSKSPVLGFYYYDFSIYIPYNPADASSVRSINNNSNNNSNNTDYVKHKKNVREEITKKLRSKKSALIDKSSTKSIYNRSGEEQTGLVDSKIPRRSIKILKSNRTVSRVLESEIPQGVSNTPLFYGSEVYNKIIKILNKTGATPKHAWVRQLGLRALEEISLVIDGEEIDTYTSELMLMLRKIMVVEEQDRGMDIMLGHIPEMYEISNNPRPSMRLYINTFFSFSRFIACSLPLVNMLYSNAYIKIKLRKIEELLYIEPGAQLSRPVKIDAKLLGRHIYLEDDERKRIATTRTVSMIERFRTVTSYKNLSDIKSSNVADTGNAIPGGTSVQFQTIPVSIGKVDRLIKERYYFDDPTKYLLWRFRLVYPNPDPKDIIYWDISAGSADENLRLNLKDSFNRPITEIKIADRIKLQMNSKTRDNWRQEDYYRRLVTHNRGVRALDLNEGLYSFALYLNKMGPQPSGSTNLTMIDDFTIFFDMNKNLIEALKAGANIRLDMFQCSHNIFMAVSGFGALGFYGTS